MTNRVGVALVITELEVGGAEQSLVNLATGLDSARFEPVVYSLAPRPQSGCDSLVQRLEAADIPVRFLGVEKPWQFLRAVRTLRRHFREQRPQVVQSFLFHANVVAAQAARPDRGIRVFLGIRVADPSVWRRWVECWASRKASRVVCVSRSVAEVCAKKARIDREKLCVIANGVELDHYPAAEPADLQRFGIATGRRVLVVIARLHRQKGLDWLLEIAPQLLARLPQHDLLIVGDGPERATLESFARRQRIDDRVFFAGFQANVPEILAASEMLLSPSRWEGMPNVVMQAMASGLPVICTRAEGIQELLGPQADAQSVPLGNRAGFVDAVVRLATNSDEWQRVGRENRARIAAEFSVERTIEAYQRLFSEPSF